MKFFILLIGVAIADRYVRLQGSDKYLFDNESFALSCTGSSIPFGFTSVFSMNQSNLGSVTLHGEKQICYKIEPNKSTICSKSSICSCSDDKKTYTWMFTQNVDSPSILFACSMTFFISEQNIDYNDTLIVVKALLVESVTIVPTGVVNVVLNENRTFTCTTNNNRPAAWIEWIINGQNITNRTQIVKTPDSTEYTKYKSTSTIVYTGTEIDHNKEVYCVAGNIPERQKRNSSVVTLEIQLPVTSVIITPASDNVVHVISGENKTFKCTTSVSRPFAQIEWKIDGRTLTENTSFQAIPDVTDNTKFVSISTFVYTGNESDHGHTIHCEASNIEGKVRIKSDSKQLYVKVPVRSVTFTKFGLGTSLNVLLGQNVTFTCTSSASRPKAWIHWTIDNRNVTNYATIKSEQDNKDDTKFKSTSTLEYTGTDKDHGKKVYCEAGNIQKSIKVKSQPVPLYITVPIQNVTLTSTSFNNVTRVILGENTSFTCTTDLSRPAAWIQWTINGRNITNQSTLTTVNDEANSTKVIAISTLVYTGNEADHEEVVFCEAVNVQGMQKVMSEKQIVFIIVPVGMVIIQPPFANNSNPIMSGEKSSLTCVTDSCRPAARIQWYVHGENVTKLATSEEIPSGKKYVTASTLIFVAEIKDHNRSITCEAMNINERGKVYVEETLYVQSKTMTEAGEELPETVFIGTNDGINLTVTLIANPLPHVTWKFQSISSPTDDIQWKDLNVSSIDLFRHVIKYEKSKAVEEDFGNYTFEAYNGIGPTLRHTFSVKPAQAPSEPFNVYAECDPLSPTINMTWESNFNGGKPQEFVVVLIKSFTNTTINSPRIYDRGQHIVHSHLQKLEYDTTYLVYVEATNEYGDVRSSQHANCTTSKRIVKDDASYLTTIIGGATGTFVAVIAIIVIAMFIFLRRRFGSKENDEVEIDCSNEEEENEELKDNPLYLSYADGLMQKSVTNRQVLNEKKREKCKADPKKKKMKEKSDKPIEMGCVYENHDDFMMQNDQTYANEHETVNNVMECGPVKNKDGLIYADLDLAPVSEDRRFIIRGIDNRNNYAIIDLNKKAEPLPFDIDDDQHGN